MLSEGEPLFFLMFIIFVILVFLGIATDLGYLGNV